MAARSYIQMIFWHPGVDSLVGGRSFGPHIVVIHMNEVTLFATNESKIMLCKF